MRPPRLLTLLAQITLPSRDREFVLGDLEEVYARTAAERGRLHAALRYARGAVASAFKMRVAAREVRRRPEGPRGRWIADWLTDTRLALRALRRRPGFTFLAAGTLAVGLGSSVAVFTMANQLVLRPLEGAGNSKSAAYLQLGIPGRYAGLTLSHFDQLREGATSFEGMASYGFTEQNVSLGEGRPIRVLANAVYGDFFDVLGVRPSEGRLLTAQDTELDARPSVVVISGSLRDRLFGSAESVAGRTLSMNGHPMTILGVTGRGFHGPEKGMNVDAWVPHGALVPLLGFSPERLSSPESTMHSEILVLPGPEMAMDAAQAQVDRVLERMRDADPDADYLTGLTPRLFPGLQTPPLARESTSQKLRMMGWAVLFIVAIACANVANLLLFRSLARRGALATLLAFGASPGRITRQQIVESALLALLGGAFGLGVAWIIMIPFRGQSLTRMPAFEGFTLGADVIVFMSLTALITAALAGALPAWLAGRFELGPALRTTRARDTGRLGPLRTMLAAGQIAMTLALVVGGMLVVRTLDNLRRVETGIDVERVVRLVADVPTDRDPTELHALHRELLARVAGVRGVQGAALDVHGPHGSVSLGRIGLPGASLDAEGRSPSGAYMWQVTPGWFELFGMEPVAGRVFEDSDWQAGPTDVVVLTASLASRLFGRTDVVGRTVLAGGREPTARRIVGVVPEYRSLRSPSEPQDAFFVLYGDSPRSFLSVFAKIETQDAGAVTAVREVLESVLPDVAVPEPVYLSDAVAEIHQEERMLGQLLWTLSALGLLMSAVGLYGAIYFLVINRKREFGIRLALGADGAGILRLVSRAAAAIVLAGTGFGMAAAYALSRIIQSQLFGVDPLDAGSYLGAMLLVVTAAGLACLAPARAALDSDPVATLREE